MNAIWEIGKSSPKDEEARASGDPSLSPSQAEAVLSELANTYSKDLIGSLGGLHHFFERLDEKPVTEQQLPNVEAKYRALVEQLPAVVFMAYLDRSANIQAVRPGMRGFELSSKSGAGMRDYFDVLGANLMQMRAPAWFRPTV